MNAPIIFAIIFMSICAFIIIADFISLFRQHAHLKKARLIKFIDRFILVFSSFVIVASFVWDFNFLRYKPAIPHKDWESISLNDFRAFKKPNLTLYGETKFAFVSTNIRVKKKRKQIIIESLFHPCRSYVYNRKLYSNGLLTHEMYHFHITEYCARLMRKELQNSIDIDQDIDIKQIKSEILLKEQFLQHQYDDETYHSYVYGKQIEWQNKIDSSLRNLEEYSNSVISLNNIIK